jgi:hypothetical protein
MQPAPYDIEIIQGQTFSRALVWKDGDGEPIDLTGYAARMQIRRSKASPDVLFELTTGNGRIAIDGAAGKVTLTITADESAAFTWRRGVYDLELEASDGVVRRLLEGAVEVNREVTR